MFDNLTGRLSGAMKNLMGLGRLTENNIKDAMQEVRTAFLEADVALPVINQFIEEVQQKALGQEVIQSIRPGDMFIKLVYDELVKMIGPAAVPLNLNTNPPAVILMAGLQGSGKTTSTAKLALWLKNKLKKSVLVTSTDVYRPAAMEQLEILAKQTGVNYFSGAALNNPVAIAEAALAQAKKQYNDVLIIDSAGRLHIDQEMMDEIVALNQTTNPIETLLVVDSMTGQDAANTAKAFAEKLPLTGIILTKADGDARGGAALSMRMLTGKPIKFMGVGEKIEALDLFYPDRIASRILGMGDILGLVEDAQQKLDQQKAQKLAKKFQKGKAFDLEDFREQLQQLRSMGGISSLLNKLPGMGANINMQAAQNKLNEKTFVQMETIINSMTPRERHFPALIKGSHKQRIAAGSGTQVQDINRVLKQFEQMQKMMKRLKGNKMMQKMMQNISF
jgi:signal recognition particle subunit SRP54